MQGLAAITANNGWAMAATGACIVITGLSVLSFIISQLHKIIAILEKKEKTKEPLPATEDKAPAVDPMSVDINALSDLQATAKLLQPFTVSLGDSFKLADLYKALADSDIPHPHLTVRELMGAGYLTAKETEDPNEQVAFFWNNI